MSKKYPMPHCVSGQQYKYIRQARAILGKDAVFVRRRGKKKLWGNKGQRIDTYSDACLIGMHVDGVLVIEGEGKTWREAVQALKRRKQRNTLQNWPQWALEKPQPVENDSAWIVPPK